MFFRLLSFALWKLFNHKEYEDALQLKSCIEMILDTARNDLPCKMGYWKLQDELNKRLHKSELNYAWKSNPSDQPYNPLLGITYKAVANRLVRVSFGLSKDRFMGPCAVIEICDREGI